MQFKTVSEVGLYSHAAENASVSQELNKLLLIQSIEIWTEQKSEDGNFRIINNQFGELSLVTSTCSTWSSVNWFYYFLMSSPNWM